MAGGAAWWLVTSSSTAITAGCCASSVRPWRSWLLPPLPTYPAAADDADSSTAGCSAEAAK